MRPELYSEQDVQSKVVVPALAALGYHEANLSVRLRFEHSERVYQGREVKTIRADIVVFVNDVPVIVVDSKNPRRYLAEEDREQVISYARLVGTVAPYAVLCNGHNWQYFDAITKEQISGLPSLEELIPDLQRRRLSPRQRTSLQSQARRTLFAIDSARELSRLMRRCHDVIRNQRGYDPTRAFDELSKVLFAKMYEERELAEGPRQENRFTAEFVRQARQNGIDVIQVIWNETVRSSQYREVFSDQEAVSEIDLPPEAIDEIVGILEQKSLGLTELDIKGVAFEEFLAGTYRGGGLGQFFTPREVVNFMVDLVAPAIGETCIDPACGTGGFLIRVYDVVREKIRSSELSDAEKERRLRELANSHLAGIDWEPRAARTCKMNMIIHGDGHGGVYQANSLDIEEIEEKVEKRKRFYPHSPALEEGTFDIVLTNPPFGARDSVDRILDRYELGRGKSAKREVLMLERCIRLLRPGGRMAVVIPEGILSNSNDRYIRNYIRRECIIKAVIRLPQDTFAMSGGAANTSILYLFKKDRNDEQFQEQGDIFFARAEYIGITPSGQPTEQNDLLSIREHYRQFEEGRWDGIELRSTGADDVDIVRDAPGARGMWLEPEVNRTSLLYDRLSYVLRNPEIENRFSYTYFHPRYFQVMHELSALNVELHTLESLCIEGFPVRGKKPVEEVSEGIPILKVRNITGQGIDFRTEYAPDNEETLREASGRFVQHGDVLITSTGEGTIGRVEIYLADEKAFADSHITICRLVEGINLKYFVEFLRSEYGQLQMLRYVSGSTGQTELLINHLKSLLIPLPSLEVQEEIVEYMNTARRKSDQRLEQAERLRAESQSILAEARAAMMEKLGTAI